MEKLQCHADYANALFVPCMATENSSCINTARSAAANQARMGNFLAIVIVAKMKTELTPHQEQLIEDAWKEEVYRKKLEALLIYDAFESDGYKRERDDREED